MHHDDTRIDMVCDHCGETFREYEWRRTANACYCSITCHNTASRTGVTRNCEMCGISFYRSPSRASAYCSRKCAFAAKRKPIEERFWDKVDTTAGPDGCWPWTASLSTHGYGQIASGGKSSRPIFAHRVSYELEKGPIPDGLIIDHLCRNRACVNPAHLEAVTYYENSKRGENPAWVSHRTNRCKRGHEFTPENTMETLSPKGTIWRNCRTCFNERQNRKYREKNPPDPSNPRRRKMTKEKADEIRARSQQGESTKDLAAAFGISVSNTSAIIRREIWR